MTCIIPLKYNDKVYIISDSRRAFSNTFKDGYCKYLTIDSIVLAFAGPTGFQNLFELLQHSIKLSDMSFVEIVEKLHGVIRLFSNLSDENQLIISNSTDFAFISNHNTTWDIFNQNDRYRPIGAGVLEAFASLKKSSGDPRLRLEEAFRAARTAYPQVISEDYIFIDEAFK